MDSCLPLAALSLRDGGARSAARPLSQGAHSPNGNHLQPPPDNCGRIEILQDLDLYYIRQIAHNLKEFDLEQKIDLEIKMREGTTKLLAACRHQTQTLEAAKNLLTSNERMSAYMAELQRRKKERPQGFGVKPCTGRVSLSDVRMPLIWRDTDHFKNKGDYRRFAVFCLARIGTEIYDTTLLCPVDRSLTDLTFPDVLVFNNIPADFEFKLEVYSHILQDDLTMASTPRKIKKTIHSSISRTVGKKLAATLRDELNSGKIGPTFELMATARLTLDEVHDSIHTHDMKVENLENRSHQLPLFGHFCCRLAAQPDCVSRESYSGEFSIREKGQWMPVWGQLQAFRLDMWSHRTDWEQNQEPLRSITVDRETIIQPSKTASKEITVSNLCDGKDELMIIRTKNTDDQQNWIRHLVQHTKDHRRWRHAAEKLMEIPSPGSTRHSFARQLRQGSLYDETPLIESVSSTDYHRPTVQEIFGMTPSTSLSSCASSSSSPTFRERSLSSGASAKGNTVRGNWPFSRNNQD
ncbi:rhotekin-like isoform X1 [Schistocerca americana]|uniref:rhotekin-like isoform X1 n=1 Tax=Schistocerca americana TaxID=7009 RepID=UPI001F4F20B7|nr:rhotekin-like isoform X1 [Schistocerca americana]XP_047113468.1 rhotekin-like isoform X2 [Schistocerca piceifrons]XP_049776341.1 rhotekin-like isoform X1 [Schistocerca cancellata]XP_049792698.1 rhotekin-like isoform X1 [Schistocerca nitens]XP_049952166.1 rhotekin-like isoform X1 [Schistocerca serialis cubense]